MQIYFSGKERCKLKKMENLKKLIIQFVNQITDYEKLRIIYTVVKNL